METLENKAKEILENEPIHDNSPELATCEHCDFSTKNKRRLKLHMKEMHEITKVEINVFCRATEKYLKSDRDSYQKELENEIDVLEDVISMIPQSWKYLVCW